MTRWLEEWWGAQDLVREGEDAFAWCCEQIKEEGPLPCFVRHEVAGGPCERPAALEIYGLAFCEVHGEECKIGALEELYFDAEQFLERFDAPHVPGISPEALRVIREGVSELQRAQHTLVPEDDEALVRAFPLTPESPVDMEITGYNYSDPERGSTPEEWFQPDRMLIHKLMRLSYEAGRRYLVEGLEEYRESTAAQLAYAIQDAEFKRALEESAQQ